LQSCISDSYSNIIFAREREREEEEEERNCMELEHIQEN
jgi:hypothetical protein